MATLDQQPAGVPPPGTVLILDQNSDIWPSILAVSVISLAILSLSISLRLYTRIWVTKNPNWDDYLSLFAAAVLVAWTVLFDVSCHLGVSKHQWNVRAALMPHILSNLNIADILLGPMLGAAKISLTIQIRRYFNAKAQSLRPFKWYACATTAVIVGYYFAVIFVAAFQCTPRRGIWEPTNNVRCISTPSAIFAEGGFALLTDLMVLVLFGWLFVVTGAQQLGGKRLVGSIMVVAFLGMACTAASLYYRTSLLDHEMDLTYHIGRLQLWAMVEYTAIIVSGCIPSIGALLRNRRNGNIGADSGATETKTHGECAELRHSA